MLQVTNTEKAPAAIGPYSQAVGFGDWIKKYQNIITSTGEVTNNDEITKLKKELSKKEKEIEILKKAVAIFSEEQKIK